MQKLLILLFLVLSLSCNADTVKLTEKNHFYLDTQVDDFSMVMALSVLQRLDKELPAGQPLYLVLKTPGGSVIAGMDFIRGARLLSRPITTVTIHSMSMGFQIVEALGDRLIVSDGIMMTHPISAQCSGRISKIKACLDFMTNLADHFDIEASKRLKMSLKTYKERSSEEWFEIGQAAVNSGMVDKVVTIKCSDEMNKKDRCPY